MTVKAVTNSTCLIGLERIERLDILPQVFNTVFAPPAVTKEVQMSLDWLIVQAVSTWAKLFVYSPLTPASCLLPPASCLLPPAFCLSQLSN